MRPGEIVAGRFELEKLAGRGGMGEVWRARDRARGGRLVGLKRMTGASKDDADRFEREARVLQSLKSPAIVEHVAHGRLEDGSPFLAMEWLDGHELADRLDRGPLTVDESITVARRVASALAAAHAHGIVHRDVKPGNVFLPDERLDQAKLLDFGVARVARASKRLTRVGELLGTPGYLAPEQARGEGSVDASADVFALGCVLFECLTGRPAFAAETLMGLLARIIFEDATRVSELLPSVPAAIDDLVASMLAKEPSSRPRDGARALEALDALAKTDTTPSLVAARPSAVVGEGELRLLSVIVAKPPFRGSEVDMRPAVADTLPGSEPVSGTRVLRPEDAGSASTTLAAMKRALMALGARVEQIADGTLVCLLAPSAHAAAATDQAARAARAALVVRAALPELHVAVATGRFDPSAPVPVGEAIDRAVMLVVDPRCAPPAVALDDLTADLLDARFAVVRLSGVPGLVGEVDGLGAPRTLLGRQTPFVGRDREMALLLADIERTRRERVAGIAVVLGAPGSGKSRLRHELVARLRQSAPEMEVLAGSADGLAAGLPLVLAAALVRSAVGLSAADRSDQATARLAIRVARFVPTAEASRVAAFLAEVVGLPGLGDEPPARAARLDARLMGDQIRRAFVDWLDAETAARPVLLVIEDLQWADAPSLRLVVDAMGRLRQRAFFVVAVGREEARSTIEPLIEGSNARIVTLGPIADAAIQTLARTFLGADAHQEASRLAALAGGSPLLLEELVRAAHHGPGDALPETVRAIVQSRIERLPSEQRRVLRAASALGGTFWEGAVAAMLGEPAAAVARALEGLVGAELVDPRASSRFPGERELSFRHWAAREAAYAMLTDDDRRRAHRRAAGWLDEHGEPDAALVAYHHEAGGRPERAVGTWAKAAEQALEATDLERALECANRGLAGGATGNARGALLLRRAQALAWLGDQHGALEAANEATTLLPVGSDDAAVAVAEAALCALRVGSLDRVAEHAAEAASWLRREAPHELVLVQAARVATALYVTERPELVRLGARLVEGIEERAAELADDRALRPRVLAARVRAPEIAERPEHQALLWASLASAMEEVGDLRTAVTVRAGAELMRWELGERDGVAARLRELVVLADRLGHAYVASAARHTLGMVLVDEGNLEEGTAMQAAAVDAYTRGDRRMEAASRMTLAIALRRRGLTPAAEHEARTAVDLARPFPGVAAAATAILADVLMVASPSEALVASSEAYRLLEELGGSIEWGESLVRRVHAEALLANDQTDEAKTVIARARDRLLQRASTLDDPTTRAGYLNNVAEHARTLELADRVLDRA